MKRIPRHLPTGYNPAVAAGRPVDWLRGTISVVARTPFNPDVPMRPPPVQAEEKPWAFAHGFRSPALHHRPPVRGKSPEIFQKDTGSVSGLGWHPRHILQGLVICFSLAPDESNPKSEQPKKAKTLEKAILPQSQSTGEASTSFPQPRVFRGFPSTSFPQPRVFRGFPSTSFPQPRVRGAIPSTSFPQPRVFQGFPSTSFPHPRVCGKPLALVFPAGRHGRQVSRNLGSLVWGRGAEKRKTHSTSFPQPRVLRLGGGGNAEAEDTVDKFPATSGL